MRQSTVITSIIAVAFVLVAAINCVSSVASAYYGYGQ